MTPPEGGPPPDDGPPPDVAGLPQPGEVLLGRLAIQRVLGIGGMGCVMAAQHVTLNTPVAVKFMRPSLARSPEAVTRFVREARAAVRLSSEHVVRIMDVATLPSGVPYMVMEYLDGSDLDEVVTATGPLPVSDAVGCLLQACDAIAEAHSLGIVHRDLKPGNLFLTRRPGNAWHLKVLDFGISKTSPLVDCDPDAESLTGVNITMGSPLFMSPEQLQDARGVDRRTDVWGLGAIAYYLLTGAPPFIAPSLLGLLELIQSSPPPSVRALRSDVPAALEAVIHACLERDRARRTATVAALVRGLAPFAAPEDTALVDRILRAADQEPPDTWVGVRPAVDLDAASAPARAPAEAAPAGDGPGETFEHGPTAPAVRDRTDGATSLLGATQPHRAGSGAGAPGDSRPRRRPAVPAVIAAAVVAVLVTVAGVIVLRGPADRRPSASRAPGAGSTQPPLLAPAPSAPQTDAGPAPQTADGLAPAPPSGDAAAAATPPRGLRPARAPRPPKNPTKGRTPTHEVFDDALRRRK